MTKKNSDKTLSREDAAELYRDVRKAMNTISQKKPSKSSIVSAPESTPEETKKLAKIIAQSISKGMAKDKEPVESIAAKSYVREETADTIARMQINEQMDEPRAWSGKAGAFSLVLLFAACKVLFGVVDGFGIMSVSPADASVNASPKNRAVQIAQVATAEGFTKEEIKLLTQLDQRRAELEERSHRLDAREQEYALRDKEFVTKLTELRDLTGTLKSERDKSEKKKTTQLDQLANVYGSMAPNEAAALMEQLDVTIALDLLARMPEKRIGQILALMHPERALTITKMLSGRSDR